jgi:hypothetical protein
LNVRGNEKATHNMKLPHCREENLLKDLMDLCGLKWLYSHRKSSIFSRASSRSRRLTRSVKIRKPSGMDIDGLSVGITFPVIRGCWPAGFWGGQLRTASRCWLSRRRTTWYRPGCYQSVCTAFVGSRSHPRPERNCNNLRRVNPARLRA